MGIMFYDGSLLFNNGELAMSEDCCCGSTCDCCLNDRGPRGVTVTISGVVKRSGATGCEDEYVWQNQAWDIDATGTCYGTRTIPPPPTSSDNGMTITWEIKCNYSADLTQVWLVISVTTGVNGAIYNYQSGDDHDGPTIYYKPVVCRNMTDSSVRSDAGTGGCFTFGSASFTASAY